VKKKVPGNGSWGEHVDTRKNSREKKLSSDGKKKEDITLMTGKLGMTRWGGRRNQFLAALD